MPSSSKTLELKRWKRRRGTLPCPTSALTRRDAPPHPPRAHAADPRDFSDSSRRNGRARATSITTAAIASRSAPWRIHSRFNAGASSSSVVEHTAPSPPSAAHSRRAISASSSASSSAVAAVKDRTGRPERSLTGATFVLPLAGDSRARARALPGRAPCVPAAPAPPGASQTAPAAVADAAATRAGDALSWVRAERCPVRSGLAGNTGGGTAGNHSCAMRRGGPARFRLPLWRASAAACRRSSAWRLCRRVCFTLAPQSPAERRQRFESAGVVGLGLERDEANAPGARRRELAHPLEAEPEHRSARRAHGH